MDYRTFIKLFSESLRRIMIMQQASPNKVIDLCANNRAGRSGVARVSHFRNGYIRHYKSGKVGFVRPTWVNGNKGQMQN